MDFFPAFGKTSENVTKNRDIKLATTKTKRKYFLSGPKLHTMKNFSNYLLAADMKKTRTLMEQSVYLGQSTVM